MNADYAPCAHQALFLHYAETGIAIGFCAGIALAAGTVIAVRAVRKHRTTP